MWFVVLMFSIAVIGLSFLCIRLSLDLRKQMELGTGWREKYYELEKGMDEQSENYEQDYLDMQEKNMAQEATIEYQIQELTVFREELSDHRQNCLPRMPLRLSETFIGPLK